jgi:hypothetical protein
MNPIKKITFILLLTIPVSCITQFIPKTNEIKEFLVVEGLITDQPRANTIKLYFKRNRQAINIIQHISESLFC